MGAFDHGIKKIAEAAGRQLAELAGVKVRTWEPLDSTLPITTELLADRLFSAQRGRERFSVYFEFYTTWTKDAPGDINVKSAIIWAKQMLPTVCIAVILRKQRYKEQGGTYRQEVGGEPTQQVWFKEVCLWKQKPERWWEDVPGLLALYPLCDHDQAPRVAVEQATRVIDRKVTSPVEKADYLSLLGIFGGLSYPKLDVIGIIGREKMKESRFFEDVRAIGREEAQREAIASVLFARFKVQPPEAVTKILNGLEDPVRLKELLMLAATCKNMAEFRDAL